VANEQNIFQNASCINSDGSKTAKLYPLSHRLNVNVMLNNMTFLMIFAGIDPVAVTLWKICCFSFCCFIDNFNL